MEENTLIKRKTLNVVICINQSFVHVQKSPINQMLNSVQMDLKSKLKKYDQVRVAYVYETPLLDVRPFEVLTEETPFYYKEPCSGRGTHNFQQIFTMGLAVIDHQDLKENDENRFYLLTDEQFNRVHVNAVMGRDNTMSTLKKRFSVMGKLKFYLYTNQSFEGRNMDLLEAWFGKENTRFF